MPSLDATEEDYLKLRTYIVGRYVKNLETLSQSHPELKDRAEDLLLVSDHALSVAIDEVIKDFKFMKIRRPEGTELLNTLTRRHVNQETLGLVFDSIQRQSIG